MNEKESLNFEHLKSNHLFSKYCLLSVQGLLRDSGNPVFDQQRSKRKHVESFCSILKIFLSLSVHFFLHKIFANWQKSAYFVNVYQTVPVIRERSN